MAAEGAWRGVANRVVLVGALGYFVDIYDLLLFNLVRTPSLKDLGLSGQQVFDTGIFLLNWQMGGLLLGGLLWGVLGDVRGRRSVLFGSIALYSLANIANAFVQTVPQYAALRFVAGIGLAGELGAAVTLVSEALPARLRGYGTMLVSSIGILGAAVGYAVAKAFDWRVAYVVGGVLGLGLLLARIAVAESGLFKRMEKGSRRSFALFLGPGAGSRLLRLGKVTLVGVPLWCAIGLLITFAGDIGRSLSLTGPVDPARAVLFAYIGASLGSLASGGLSQLLKSRRLAIMVFVNFTALVAGAFLLIQGQGPSLYYGLSFLLGLGVGYWAVFAQVAAEQFGTDLRATVATAAPNLVRGAVVVLTPTFKLLNRQGMALAPAAVLLMAVTLAIALVAAWRLRETYGVDLDFTESNEAPMRSSVPDVPPA